jgi:hypothetical protein
MAQFTSRNIPQWLLCGMNTTDGVLLMVSDQVHHCNYSVQQYMSSGVEVTARIDASALYTAHGKDYPEAFANFIGDLAASGRPPWEGPHWGATAIPRDGLGNLDEYEIAVIRELRHRRSSVAH